MIWKLYEGREDDFQKSLAQMLDNSRVLWFHVANERSLNSVRDKRGGSFSPLGNKLKAMGVKKGAPDVVILKPSGPYSGMLIELKANKTGKMSEEQRDFFLASTAAGYFHLVSWSMDEVLYYYKMYMYAQKNGEAIQNITEGYKDMSGKIYVRDGLKLKRKR